MDRLPKHQRPAAVFLFRETARLDFLAWSESVWWDLPRNCNSVHLQGELFLLFGRGNQKSPKWKMLQWGGKFPELCAKTHQINITWPTDLPKTRSIVSHLIPCHFFWCFNSIPSKQPWLRAFLPLQEHHLSWPDARESVQQDQSW